MRKLRPPFQITLALAFIFSALSTLPLQAQNLRDTLFEYVRGKMEPLIAAQTDEFPFDFSGAFQVGMVEAMLNLKDPFFEPLNKDEIYDLRIGALEHDWGLKLRSQVYHQFGDFAKPGSEIDEATYPTRFRTGVEWDILKGGYFANQNKIKQLQNEKEIEWLEYDGRRNFERLFFRRNLLTYLFNKEKIKVLEKRLATLTEELEMLQQIYYLRDVMFEEVIARRSRLEQTQVQLKNYRDFNALMESTLNAADLPAVTDVLQLPILELDIEKMLQDSLFTATPEQLQALENENRRLKNDWANQISLSAQLNQHIVIANPGDPSRTFPSMGLNLELPFEIFFTDKIQQQLMAAENLEREQRRRYMQLNNSTEIVNLYYEYNYKLKTFVEYLYKYLLYDEKMRVEQVNRTQFSDYYQPFDMLRYHDNLREIKLELLDLKQQLYLTLLNIYAKTPLKSLRPYLRPAPLEQYLTRLPGNRMVFVSSEDFAALDRQFLDKYLIFNDFKYVLVKDGDWSRRPPAVKNSPVKFLKTIDWNPPTPDMQQWAGALAFLLPRENMDGIVLQIPGNLQSRDFNLTAGLLEDFLSNFRKESPGSPLFLSIPAHFPLKLLVERDIRFDKIILRTTKWQDALQFRNSALELSLFEKMPLCIMLDVRQFKDRLKLETYIAEVMRELEVENVLFDNLSAFIEMETKGMMNDE